MSLIARGDTLLGDGEALEVVESPIPKVSREAWTKFVHALATGGLSAVSDSNGLGMFEMMPRRLADLGVLEKLSRGKGKTGRTIWTAKFVPPMTSAKFLTSPDAQYSVFEKSMVDYVRRLARGEIAKSRDAKMSLSGMLAILHRSGPAGLKTWDEGERFASTVAAYDKARGIF